VHETAHEWWGNSVTAADMADIWLQEGFATYAELMFLEHKYGYEEYVKQLASKEMQIFNYWPVIQNYNVNENAFASNDCYNKGAAVLNNLRCCINNDSVFFGLLKNFALKYKKKVVTTMDFINMVNQTTGKNYSPLFKKYLYDKEIPVLTYSYKKEGTDLVLTFNWDEVDRGFEMPFSIYANEKCFRLNGTTEPQTIVLSNTHTFHFINPWVSADKTIHNSCTYFWTKCTNHL
jgi:aminopeptidase N